MSILVKMKAMMKLDRVPLFALILIDFFAVMVGVLLGFWLNERREFRQNQEFIHNAYSSLASEMQYNHDRIVMLYDYYEHIVNNINEMAEDNPDFDPVATYGMSIPDFRGAMPPMLRSSTYQMLISSGLLKDMPFEHAENLSLIYNTQSLIEKMDDAMILSFSDDSGFTRISNIYHKFSLFLEIMPIALAMYQNFGLPILEDYGYEFFVHNDRLLQQIEFQSGDFN